MSIRSVTHLGVLGLAMLMGVGALAVHARQNDKPPDTAPPELSVRSIGGVDMEQLYEASGGRAALEQKANELGADMDKRLNAMESAPYLTADERLEYVGLLEKFTPDAAQQARMNALKALSDQRAGELQALTVKQALTPMDKARLDELVGQKRSLDQALPGVQEVARMQQQERVEEFRREQLKQLRAAVAQVAKQKGITNVFDANALVYSANDLTPLVIQHLGKALPRNAEHAGH